MVIEDEYQPCIILAPFSPERHLDEELRYFPPDFFDVVVLDEIHRDTIVADREWQGILDWFQGAVHIGFTMIDFPSFYPSNYHFFEKVIYRYTAEQAKADGYHQIPEIIAAQAEKGILHLPQKARANFKEIPAS